MTTVLYRYFFSLLTRTVIAVVVAISGLFFVLTLLENLSRQGTDGVFDDLRDTFLTMPEVVIAALPACCAIGSSVCLAIMDGRTEFALLRIMGTSKARLLFWIVSASLAWVLVFAALTEYVLPNTAAISREIEIRRSGSLLTSDDEVWLKTSEGFARVGAISSDGRRISDLWTFSSDSDSVELVRHARIALHRDGDWTLVTVSEANLASDGNWEFSEKVNHSWTHGPDPELLTAFTIKPVNLPFRRLVDLSASLRDLEENTVAIDLIIWSRVFDAASIIFLMIAGYALVRNRTKESPASIRAAAVISLVTMIIYYYFQVIIRQHAVDANWPGIAGAALPPLVFAVLILSVLALRRDV